MAYVPLANQIANIIKSGKRAKNGVDKKGKGWYSNEAVRESGRGARREDGPALWTNRQNGRAAAGLGRASAELEKEVLKDLKKSLTETRKCGNLIELFRGKRSWSKKFLKKRLDKDRQGPV